MSSDPEEASAYLARTNFKQLIEWLTAEAILRRPDDPLLFARDLVEQKLGERGLETYDPDQATKYVQRCYSDAAALADEHGRIYGHVASRPGGFRAQVDQALQDRVATLERLVKAATEIRTLEPHEACSKIVACGIDLLQSDRASIFIVRPGKAQVLDLHVAEGARGISVPFGKGIAGTVAETQEMLNIADAYSDPRFDSTADGKSGFKTQNVLAAPIMSPQDGVTVTGVLQIVNKKAGPFNSDDEEALNWLSGLAGVALYTATCFQGSVSQQRRAEAIVDLVHAVHEHSLGINSLIYSLTTRLPQIAECDRCTVFIVDHHTEELWAMQGEVNIKIPIASNGIAPACCRQMKKINIASAYADDRFNQQVDVDNNYKTDTILCLPMIYGKDMVGVVQLINKLPSGTLFSDEDEKLMEVFLGIVSGVIANMNLNKRHERRGGTDLEDKALSDHSASPQPRTAHTRPAPPADAPLLEEGDEDEDEDD